MAGSFLLAALLEIAGCFAFWAWWRGASARSGWGLGVAALLGFAVVAGAGAGSAQAGRAFAAYGGVYIVASAGLDVGWWSASAPMAGTWAGRRCAWPGRR